MSTYSSTSSVSSSSTAGRPVSPVRVLTACSECRSSKRKCGGEQPACARCERLQLDCQYVTSTKKRGPPVGKDIVSKLKAELAEMKRQQEMDRRNQAHQHRPPPTTQSYPHQPSHSTHTLPASTLASIGSPIHTPSTHMHLIPPHQRQHQHQHQPHLPTSHHTTASNLIRSNVTGEFRSQGHYPQQHPHLHHQPSQVWNSNMDLDQEQSHSSSSSTSTAFISSSSNPPRGAMYQETPNNNLQPQPHSFSPPGLGNDLFFSETDWQNTPHGNLVDTSFMDESDPINATSPFTPLGTILSAPVGQFDEVVSSPANPPISGLNDIREDELQLDTQAQTRKRRRYSGSNQVQDQFQLMAGNSGVGGNVTVFGYGNRAQQIIQSRSATPLLQSTPSFAPLWCSFLDQLTLNYLLPAMSLSASIDSMASAARVRIPVPLTTRMLHSVLLELYQHACNFSTTQTNDSMLLHSASSFFGAGHGPRPLWFLKALKSPSPSANTKTSSTTIAPYSPNPQASANSPSFFIASSTAFQEELLPPAHQGGSIIGKNDRALQFPDAEKYERDDQLAMEISQAEEVEQQQQQQQQTQQQIQQPSLEVSARDAPLNTPNLQFPSAQSPNSNAFLSSPHSRTAMSTPSTPNNSLDSSSDPKTNQLLLPAVICQPETPPSTALHQYVRTLKSAIIVPNSYPSGSSGGSTSITFILGVVDDRRPRVGM